MGCWISSVFREFLCWRDVTGDCIGHWCWFEVSLSVSLSLSIYIYIYIYHHLTWSHNCVITYPIIIMRIQSHIYSILSWQQNFILPHSNIINTDKSEAKIDYTLKNSKCTLCVDRDETVNFKMSECFKLIQNDYDWAWLGRKGDPPGIVQEIKIQSY